MATATRQPRTQGHVPSRAADVRVPSLEFLIFEDNAGDYHWTVVAGDGATLARSGGFASYDYAKQAVEQIRHGVASARFEASAAGARPIDVIVRRDASGEDSNAERGLDAGGSFSNEAVAK
jgi:uncharacterized protein YegP (UPF0339 family)